MRKLKSTLFIALLCTAISAQAQETIQKTFSGVERIKLTTASGNGTIKKGNTDEVKVTLTYTYDEDDYQPEFEQRGTSLIIEEEFRRSRYTRGYSEWTLEIPDGLALDFKTGSGNIEIEGLTIEIQANSGSGNIEVMDVKGDTRANTGSGNIEVEDVEGNVDANTGSGSIRIRSINGDTDLNTGSGNIRGAQIEGAISMNTGSGNIEMLDAILNGSSSLRTGSGNARIVLAATLNTDISINTGSGNATLDFNGQEIEGRFIMKAQDKDDIRAPFKFDGVRGDDDDDDRGWRRGNYTKEAEIGNKDIVIKISTGSGRAEVKK